MNRLTQGLIDDFKRLQNQISITATSAKSAGPKFDDVSPYQHLITTFCGKIRAIVLLMGIDESELELISPDMGTSPWRAKADLQILKMVVDSIALSLVRDEQKISQQKEFLIDQGKSLTAHNIISQILGLSEKSLKVVDNYLSEESASIIEGYTNCNVDVSILTTENNKKKLKNFLEKVDIIKKGWKGRFEVKKTTAFHDRFIIVDDKDVWFSGPSIDSLGIQKPGVICNLTDIDVKNSIISKFNSEWSSSPSVK